MKKHFYTLLFICFSLVGVNYAKAQTASVKISGEVTSPFTVNDDDLQKFIQTTITRKDRDGNDHAYSGVLLSELMNKAGAGMGSNLKGENLTKYLLVTASDNYQVVFELPELDKAYTDRMIILADKMDGKPLPAGDGPFRIIVQDEKRPARCIKQVTGLKVLFAK